MKALLRLGTFKYDGCMSDDKNMISDGAVEAVYDKFFHLGLSATEIEGILAAAAPHMLAGAWEDGANAYFDQPGTIAPCWANPYRSHSDY